ncbi:hypothetical protein Amsp01_016940 [Amycolatopsis sp. NBRC 101858]|uniref:hypothetical protein n=1 Tax=Amycolatopsis sp. NBRC 101858 TaxID=3032200 RepID=UPI0024A28756|nr:hypothetical protein [Amycolatopsis sp. NBRC 101858]GLY35670.1 hypothetical protein Amsp01_016940 [Amycolatopsis sp. NBRC 101858]
MREDNVRKIWSDAELDAALADLHDDVDEDDGLAFARASLMAAVGTSEAPPAATRRGPWRWIAVAAAVVTLVGGLAIITSLRAPAPEPARPAATLGDLDRPLEPGEFHYAQKLQWLPESLEGQSAEMQQSVELWIPADPTGVWHRRTKWTGAVRGFGGAKSVQVNSAPFDEAGPAGRFGPGQHLAGQIDPRWNTPFQNWLLPDAAFIASLTPDRGTLAKRLNFDTIDQDSRAKVHTPTEALTMVRTALETGLVRKDIRFALRDAFTMISGAFVAPGHTPDGRPATVLTVKDSGQRLYLDPDTAQLLAWDANPTITPTTIRSNEVVRSTAKSPPPSSGITGPATTTPESPAGPPLPGDLATEYSFAITRTSG